MIGARPFYLYVATFAAACAGSHSRGPGEAAPASGAGGAGAIHVLDEGGQGGAGAAGQAGTASAAGAAASAGSAGHESVVGGAGGMPGSRGIAAADASPVVPEFGDTGVGMWVGELWFYAPVLCDPNAVPGEFPMGVPGGHRERVVLILDSDGAELAGRIAFGEGELPSSPASSPAHVESDWFWACSAYMPALGGVYEVRSAVQRKGRLTFEIAPNEIWNDWCRRERYVCPETRCGQLKTCTCDGDLCEADLSMRVVIDLTARADELEGVLNFEHYSPELRLRRVQ